MKPYYEEHGITIYHGDCREVLPTLGHINLVLTDPPYGVGFEFPTYIDTLENWKELMIDLVGRIRATADMGILPSCQIKQLEWIYKNVPPDWLLCWFKGATGCAASVGFNDWEPLLVYGRTEKLCMHDHFLAIPETPNFGHPCPKPIQWAKTLIQRATKDGMLVVDPFMGSGTTLRAAKDLGRRAIGIEIEEKYCEIAVKRLSQKVLPF
jgi:site-specific DNA-methyltransferase (adenine-specific)